jgi:UDP-GlcNAc:undecaprenyl-phosphate GlcNAc-1-phosphate transferase
LFAVGTAVALSYAVVLLSVPPSGVLSFFCIDLLVLAAFAAGVRCLYRILDYTYQCETASGDGVVIYGAGRGGQLVVREMLQNAALGLRPVGFIDDDPRLWRRMIQRVQVFGSVAELASVLERYPVGSVVISSEKIRPDCLAQALSVCSARQVPVLRAHLKLEPIGPNGNGGEYGEALSALVPATQPGLSRPVEDGKM